jgi:hypothetical protein
MNYPIMMLECRFLAIFLLLIPVVASGCAGCNNGAWQANNASEAVSFGPNGLGPADAPGYMNGEPMNMRK